MKRGSALLIVLGMLSFMVISAVAFSMFMRQSRLPSSFVRQRILARQMVKAGLAQAMSEIDRAVGAAPYPGIGSSDGAKNHANSRNNESIADCMDLQSPGDRNFWKNRVLMFTDLGETGECGAFWDPTAGQTGAFQAFAKSDDDEGLPQEKTVSTFPLEGLAYLPPPLVNTVRYWSRHTPTAQWRNLDFDSGRFAYTAVNVSDYLDINRLKANVMRDSSPSNRISLAFLFEDDKHETWGEISPKKFDDAMKKLDTDARGRLVSMADYNMAVGGGQLNGIGFKSPFYEYFNGGGGDGSFYGSNEDQARRQKFITDSWYPGTNVTASTIFLTDDNKGQPFDGKQQSLDALGDKDGSEAYSILCRRLDLCSFGALYDYVDEDSVPISLAIPTVERAPMLTGISLETSGFAVTLAKASKPITGAAGTAKPDERMTWSVDTIGPQPKVTFSCCGVFPFKRTPPGYNQPTSYDVQVLVKMYLSDQKQTQARFADDKPVSTGGASLRPTDAAWSNQKDKNELFSAQYGACYTAYAESTATLKKDESSGAMLFDVTGVQISFADTALQGAHVYGLLQKYKLDPNTGLPIPDGAPTYDPTDMTNPLLYHPAGGGITDVKTVGANGPQLYLNFACWVRIVDANGDTLDLVPATMADDQLYNGHNSGTMSFNKICGDRDPMLPMTSADPVLLLDQATVSKSSAPEAAAAPVIDALDIACDDPRFNWAPEDWYKVSGAMQASAWLSDVQNRLDGFKGADHRQLDILQFVSNQGYLQSMGELQFLPYIRSFKENNSPIVGNFYDYSKYDGLWAADDKDTANKDFTWRTHFAFGANGDYQDGDDCDPWSFGIQDTNGGVAINPYADEDLLMAALANTPYDYMIASENKDDSEKDLEKNIQYCFNAQGSDTKITWKQMQEIAQKIRTCTANHGDDWARWPEWDEDGILGVAVDGISDVDRKFLFSYWKQCFANSQQLFLVFVRAEPTVVGGDGGGHTPSQLGARAVALVWREPTSSLSAQNGEPTPPHRMRILFYHQFE